MKKLIIILILLITVVARAADTKVTGLTELTAVDTADVLYIVDDAGGTPTSKKITLLNLLDAIDTSAELLAILGDETGTGVAVFGTAPTLTGVNIAGSIDYTAGNIVYVPLAGDIQTYVTAATAGDTLVLSSGVYTITSTITIAKELNIVGQGSSGFVTDPVTASHGTLITSTTAAVVAFQINNDNVRVANLSINLTGAGSTGVAVANNLQGVVFNNIDVIVNSTGANQGFNIIGSDVILRDMTFYITSSDSTAAGCMFQNNSSTTQNAILDGFNVTGTVVGGATYAYAFVAWNINDGNSLTLNLSNSVCKSLTGTPLDIAVACTSTTTNNATVNAYMCTFEGADYDAYQTGSNVLNLGGSVLENATVFGTVTYRATMASAAAVFSTNMTSSQITLTGSDASPDATGEIRYDTTVAGVSGGAIELYDDDEIKYFMGIPTLPTDAEDDYHMAYDMDTDELYWKADADTGGSTLWNNIGNPNGDNTIPLASYETTFTTSLDEAAHTAYQIQHTDPDVTNPTTFLFTINTATNDDADLNLLRIYDDSGGTPDVIFDVAAGKVHVGADDQIAYQEIHDAGTLTMYDDSDDTSVTIGPVADGTTTLGITGNISGTGDISATGNITSIAGFNSGLYDAVGAVDIDYGSVDITDHSFTTNDCTFIIDGGITVSTGDTITLGATAWNSGDSIDGEVIAADTIDNDSIDWADMTDLDTDGAVVWGNIAEGELADSTVVSADIKDDTIESADYAPTSIDQEHIAADVIDFTELNDNMTLDATTKIATAAFGLEITVANPTASGFEVNGTGAFVNDLMHVHQHTGNPTGGTLAHFESVDTDVSPMVVVHQDKADIDADVVGVLIDAVDDDDPNWKPLEIRDDSDTNNDLLFFIDYTGTITTGIWNSAGNITSTGVVDLGGATSVEITNNADPDVDAAGEISQDTDGANETSDVTIRAYDGTNQWPVGQKIITLNFTLISPDTIDAADLIPVWHNTSGMTFTIVEWKAWSDDDDVSLEIEELTDMTDFTAITTVDAVEIATNGTSVFYASDTTITHAAIEHDHSLAIDFDTSDTPDYVQLAIKGWYNADVN
jgi:hypothetical protein